MGKLYIGLSGYSYKPWVGRFYPEGTKAGDLLGYYAGRYPAVEMDGTWYRMPSEAAVQAWLGGTPEGFRFCFKAHRQVTHMARLKEAAVEPIKFQLKRLAPMRARLGPILLQLPPNSKRHDDRLASFLDRVRAEIPEQEQWAVEFRNDTWHAPEVEAILRDRNVAWVAADTDEADAQRRQTAGYLYARLRRSEYTRERLADWAAYFRGSGVDAHVFCKHEDEGSPWEWADALVDLYGS
ncbi:MAG: DUF72 domain-containing protein [Fimbriimonas ginsengisoli]|uniref:DUF72 domain-containing protein n=1 Tax=Fimbriimonas ginsengisoli TaxID=1005039 RepID=A0A931LWL0_FIMGI|nr:DUF72 domain-containing protein [Fimbriimonas ginsengisoli]